MTMQIKIKYLDETQTRISKIEQETGLIFGQLKM